MYHTKVENSKRIQHWPITHHFSLMINTPRKPGKVSNFYKSMEKCKSMRPHQSQTNSGYLHRRSGSSKIGPFISFA